MVIPQLILLGCGIRIGTQLYKKFIDKEMTPHPEAQEPQGEQRADTEQREQETSDAHLIHGNGVVEEAVDEDEEAYEDEVDHHLKLSTGSMAIALAGPLIYPPLAIVSGCSTIYSEIPIFKTAKKAIFKEKRARIEILDCVAVTTSLLSGYYFIAALSNFCYYGAEKIRIRTENSSRKSIASIFEEQPRFVWLIKEGVEVQIPFEALDQGDVIAISSGNAIPADGIIVSGHASIDQHKLTGETQLAEKGVGEAVFAATVITAGAIHVEVTKAGKETVESQISAVLQNTSNYTDFIENSGKEVADASVIPALSISFAALPFVGPRGTVALLSSNFMDNMRLISPISMLNFLQMASETGIMIKDGRSLQLLSQVDTIVFDKTGTLTLEEPELIQVYHTQSVTKKDVLTLAAAAEYRQTHPVALAILSAATREGLSIPDIDASQYKVGYGITIHLENMTIRVGSGRFMKEEKIVEPDEFAVIRREAGPHSSSFVFVARDHEIIGMLALEIKHRPEAKAVIQHLKKRNISIHMISGDLESPTKSIADALGIEHYYAEVLPEQKARYVASLRDQGKKVCFVGDGINDAIALKTAETSISISGASTVAMDSAQIVLMDQSLQKIPALFDMADQFRNNMRNTFKAIGVPCILCVGGVFFSGFTLSTVCFMYAVSMVSGSIVSMIPKAKFVLAQKEMKPTASSQRKSDMETANPSHFTLSDHGAKGDKSGGNTWISDDALITH